MKSSRLILSLLPLAIACADDGDAGKNSLVLTSQEAAGSHCDAGGLKVESGLDANGNGKLEATEVASTEYVCSGADGSNGTNGTDGANGTDGLGAEDVTTRVTAASAAACPGGGQQVEFLNAAGVATGEPLVVCGADLAQTFGAAPYAQAHRILNDGPILATRGQPDPVVLSASITVPRAGYVVAQTSATIYCTTPPVSDPQVLSYGVCSPTTANTIAFLTVVDHATPGQNGTSGSNKIISGVVEDRSTEISDNGVFGVQAGTHTFDVYGRADESTASGAANVSVSYVNPELTLFFIPAAS